MTNNDVLRRMRYIFDFDDSKMIFIFTLVDHEVTRAEISDWLKKEDDPAHKKINDNVMAKFLNGLIIEKRGRREGNLPVAEKRLSNNIILNKIKIALNMKAEDVIEALASADLTVSKHELSALFRKPGHKHYRECKDQLLRNFLKGIQLQLRNSPPRPNNPDPN